MDSLHGVFGNTIRRILLNSKTALLILHTITPLHCGTGSEADVIDLPVAREKTTGIPIVPATSLKGVLRADPVTTDKKKLYGEDGSTGALAFTDMHLLCLPMRSFSGVFAWVTCPFILNRLHRDCKLLNVIIPEIKTDSYKIDDAGILKMIVSSETSLKHGGKIYLDDIDFDAQNTDGFDQLALSLASLAYPGDQMTQDVFRKHFGIVSDNVFCYLVKTGTDVVARISLNEETKTAQTGALWYEETVPSESLFYSFIQNTQSYEYISPSTVQIGGNASVGQGLCRLVSHPGDTSIC